MKKPRVSIVTSVCNATSFIEGLLKNIISQTTFDKCELIMVQPQDKLCQETENVIKKYQKEHPNILYSTIDKDPGIYAVWNQCIRNASGEFVTNWNCDDRREPDSLQKQIDFFDKNPDIDLLYNDQYFHTTPNWIPWDERYAFKEPYPIRHNKKINPQFSVRAMADNIPHNDPTWRISLHERLGYFREDTITCADHEFWLRCVIAGSKFAKMDDIVGVYYNNPNGISTRRGQRGPRKRERARIIDPLVEIINNINNK